MSKTAIEMKSRFQGVFLQNLAAYVQNIKHQSSQASFSSLSICAQYSSCVVMPISRTFVGIVSL